MSIMRKIYLRLKNASLVLFIVFLSLPALHAFDIEKIPAYDRRILDDFFRNLLFHYEFAYTLFGDKPISTETFDYDDNEKPDLFRSSSIGYKTWQKYVHLFSMSNYIFLFYEDSINKVHEITLINKKAFKDIVNQNHAKFASCFSSSITADKLLDLLIERQSLWNTPMQHRDDLIGILLGFGVCNADLFQKRKELTMSNTGIRKKRTKPSPGYPSPETELEAIECSLQPFSNEGKIPLTYMRLPGFKADPKNPETKKLKQKYAAQRKMITQHYMKGDVLRLTCEKLCQ